MMTLIKNRKLEVLSGIVISALVIVMFAMMTSKAEKGNSPQISNIKTEAQSTNHDLTGDTILDDIEKHSKKLATVNDAKSLLPYNFPVPPENIAGHNLIGIYVENNNILYLRYTGELYLIYHQLPEGFDPKIDETKKQRPDVSEIAVRGQRGLATRNDTLPANAIAAPKATLGWYEKGLSVTLYDYDNSSVDGLKDIAESMQ
ncbi:MAG: hypothetical protein ACYC56_01505 [Candidatus Aquicultor sp.]